MGDKSAVVITNQPHRDCDEEDAILNLGAALGIRFAPWFFALLPVRFVSDSLEKDFRTAQGEKLQHGFVFCGKIIVFGAIIWLALGVPDALPLQSLSQKALACARIMTVLLGIFMFSCGRYGFCCGDRSVTCITISFMLIILLNNKRRLAYFVGEDPEIVWPDDDVSTEPDDVAVRMIGVVNAFYIFGVPRWTVGWPVALSFPLLYLACTLPLPGSKAESVERWRVTLSALVFGVMGLYGRVYREVLERKQFAHSKRSQEVLVNERVLRYQAERAQEGSLQVEVGSLADSPHELLRKALHKKKSCGESSTRDSGTTAPSGRIANLIPRDRTAAIQAIEHLALNEKWLINNRHMSINRHEILGKGGFGTVHKGTLVGTPVAVKYGHTQDGQLDGKHLSSLFNEFRHLRHVRHENIVLFYGAYMDIETTQLALVLEFVPGSQLRAFIEDAKGCTSETDQYCILRGICRALRYLHSNDPAVVHSDLSPSNVMIQPFGKRNQIRAKLLDFGLARSLTRLAKPAGGTKWWSAPEVLNASRRSPYMSPAVDAYSFGKLTHFVLTKGVIDVSVGPSGELLWPPATNNITGLCADSANECVHADPESRPTMLEVAAVLFPGDVFNEDDPSEEQDEEHGNHNVEAL